MPREPENNGKAGCDEDCKQIIEVGDYAYGGYSCKSGSHQELCPIGEEALD